MLCPGVDCHHRPANHADANEIHRRTRPSSATWSAPTRCAAPLRRSMRSMAAVRAGAAVSMRTCGNQTESICQYLVKNGHPYSDIDRVDSALDPQSIGDGAGIGIDVCLESCDATDHTSGPNF